VYLTSPTGGRVRQEREEENEMSERKRELAFRRTYGRAPGTRSTGPVRNTGGCAVAVLRAAGTTAVVLLFILKR